MSRTLLAALCVLCAAAPACPEPSRGARPDPGAKPKMYVLLWFDTEDLLLKSSDDAALRNAQFCTKEGVKANFKIVGEKVRVLEQRGRTDVIEALKKHEIGYHSEWHSVHPTPAQTWTIKPAILNAAR